MRSYSLRRRLLLAMLAITTAIVVGLSILLYLAMRDVALSQHDDGQLARARALAGIAEYDDEDGYEMELPPLPGSYVVVYKPNGELLANSSLEARALHPLTSRPSGSFRDWPLPDGRQGRMVVYRFVPRSEGGTPGQLTMLLGESAEDVAKAIAAIRIWFVVIGLCAIAATAGLVIWIVARALAPLPRLATSIAGINDTSLDQRLPLDGQPAELIGPIEKLNDLLARLAASFSRERQFTADVSHELRTPLAGLRTLLEVTALTERSAAYYETALADAHRIVLQLGALIDNLLLLARLDAGQLPVERTDVDVAALVTDCWKPHAELARSRSLELRMKIPAGTHVMTDREKLRSVLGNLLANAAEYTSPGGWIEVSTSEDIVVSVADSGPSIAPEQLNTIFDRFSRGDAARAGGGVHCGIGLALARSLCAAMQLTLTAETRTDGSVSFTCRALVTQS